MPELIGSSHDLFIKNLYQTGKSTGLNKFREVIGLSKEGFIFPVKIFLNYFLENPNDICFSSLILKIPQDCYYILADSVGKIFGVSENFFIDYIEQHLNSHKNLKKYNIALIIPEFFRLVENIDMKNSETYLDLNSEMIIPSNFEKLIKILDDSKKRTKIEKFLRKKGKI